MRRTLSAVGSLDRKPPKPNTPPPQLKKKISTDTTTKPNLNHLPVPPSVAINRYSSDSNLHNGNFKPSEIAKMQKRALSPPLFSNPVFSGKSSPTFRKTDSKGSLGTSSSSSDETSMVSHCCVVIIIILCT